VKGFCIKLFRWLGLEFPQHRPAVRQARSVSRVLPPNKHHVESRPLNDLIVIDSRICHGKPVIRATRLPVEIVVGSLIGGMTSEEIQREYGLTASDICAAWIFVAELSSQESSHSLPVA